MWFTGEGPGGTGAFYAKSRDRGASFSPPMRLGPEATLAHAVVLSRGSRVAIAWMEAAGAGRAVRVMHSVDSGATWSHPREAASTAGLSDSPLLVSHGEQLYLSWFTPAEGYRLIAIAD